MQNNRITEITVGKRYFWEDIMRLLPDRWVGLDEVEWDPDNDATILSAVVKYLDKSRDEMSIEHLSYGTVYPRYTTPDNVFQVGALF